MCFLSLQFAYHEAIFYLVRLLQQFTGFQLEMSENVQPPPEWAACDGLKATEKVYLAAALITYVKVSVFSWNLRTSVWWSCFLGWPLGANAAVVMLPVCKEMCSLFDYLFLGTKSCWHSLLILGYLKQFELLFKWETPGERSNSSLRGFTAVSHC